MTKNPVLAKKTPKMTTSTPRKTLARKSRLQTVRNGTRARTRRVARWMAIWKRSWNPCPSKHLKRSKAATWSSSTSDCCTKLWWHQTRL